MPEMTSYEHGVPCWVDVAAPDLDKTKEFYGELFGWEAQSNPDPQYGGYTMFTVRDAPVAAAMPLMAPGQPPAWTCYVKVDDIKATAAKVRAAGGVFFAEPMEVPGQGHMAVFADTLGAVSGMWQPTAFEGAGLVNEPGAFCWSELACRDLGKAKEFYTAVYGWEAETRPFGAHTYTEWKVGGRAIAGMIEMDDNWPPEVPPNWSVYFAVADCDATVAKNTGLGGSVMVPPTDIPGMGRFAVLGDAAGAYFSVMSFSAAE